MLRLINIEFFKLKNTRYFWVLGICFLFFLLAVPVGCKIFLDYLGGLGEEITDLGIRADQLPLFDFVDIWQNLTWVYKNFSVLLGFIIVISVCNEFSYGTVKQNVIDGLSRKEFLWTKISFIILISAAASLFALVVGLIMGFLWSPVQGLPFILKNIEFIPAYFLQLVGFQLFCLIISLLIKRSGFVLALLIFYIYILEPILSTVLTYKYELPFIADLLPLNAVGGLIHFPFKKYALMEVQTYVGASDVLVAVVYIAAFLWASHYLITKRDLA